DRRRPRPLDGSACPHTTDPYREPPVGSGENQRVGEERKGRERLPVPPLALSPPRRLALAVCGRPARPAPGPWRRALLRFLARICQCHPYTSPAFRSLPPTIPERTAHNRTHHCSKPPATDGLVPAPSPKA